MRCDVTELPVLASERVGEDVGVWCERMRARVRDTVTDFVGARCREHLDVPETAVLAQVITDFAARGKYLRSAFQLAGWLTVEPERRAAVRAAASAELLHCFALMQDDVMDQSAVRRGMPAAHVRFAQWHRYQGFSGESERFGESAAVLAADLCLVWAEQLLRESGVSASALARVMPRYAAMRSELAVGQFRDLVNDSVRRPALGDVLAVARAKSGNYTVRRPLELGATLAGASPGVLAALARYGAAVGEAFQLRDDLLGVFGDPEVTGKPVGDDIRARKATSVLVSARDHAEGAAAAELDRLDAMAELPAAAVARYVEILEDMGTRERVEKLIEHRVHEGLAAVADAAISPRAHAVLTHLAHSCTDRTN
ncbi:geranylgeranyl diphosphate synthase type I [Nocardia pseudobrasiliensis]|uniref:Geranylgeranyl diphosphate synthase type I n=1 Tax=Nocardia pseudobrasiliensis TaxID=45979 RepID=A0A370HUB7_9NOCA|nr:geranylgeranyl diphosphate synthase type I [Nocardia pseudobrasiliensis]